MRWAGQPVLLLALAAGAFGDQPLRISVYATAGDIHRYLAAPEERQRAAAGMRRLRVSGIFLEGRRGDEYVPPGMLRALRDYFASQGFRVAGGIATVPGESFGVRQNGKPGWLNWGAEKTQRDVAVFFSENAAVFDELIVDDFYCTADTSSASEQARGGRSWSDYRRDLLVSLIEPLMRQPARRNNPSVRLILKYPQWYDRFQLFGYDPPRMSAAFERIWVGTEVRNPTTQRMGYVQPTQGYMNYRWLASVAGSRVEGAWFDHIECTAQNLLDQAFQSVLAGTREITLFHLGDVVQGHPGHALLEAALPDLIELAAKIEGRAPRGIAFYKPPGSEGDGDLFLMDYLGMIGLPIVPEATYPAGSRVAVLGRQAGSDPRLLEHVRRHLAAGASVVLTLALLRSLGPPGEELAGVKLSSREEPGLASAVGIEQRELELETPLEVDVGIEGRVRAPLITAMASGRHVPLLVSRASGRGRVYVWNVRTFSEQDYRDTGELLLPPKPRGLPAIPRALADELRRHLLGPLGIRLSAPAGVALYDFGDDWCLYNFRGERVEVRANRQAVFIPPNGLKWVTRQGNAR